MKIWEELSELEKKQATFWDFYKDVHGVRPRWVTEEQINDEAWLDAQMERLSQCAMD